LNQHLASDKLEELSNIKGNGEISAMSTTAAAPQQDRDERLASVLDALAKQQAAGQAIDYDALGKQHPDLID
jgi:hypothetical protein